MMKKFLMATMIVLSVSSMFAATFTDDFEDGDINGWVEEAYSSKDANGEMAIATDDVHGGTYSLKATVTAGGDSFDYAPCWDVPVNVGDDITATVWAKYEGTGSGVRIWGSWNDSTNSYLSSASGNSSYAAPGAGWTELSYNYGAAPADAAYIRVQMRVYYGADTEYAWLDDGTVTGSSPVSNWALY